MYFTVSGNWLLLAAGAAAGVGYTLLAYSADGDLALRAKTRARFSDAASSSRDEAWARMATLANTNATEVTWNTSLAVALVASFAFLGLAAHLRGEGGTPPPPATVGVAWLLALFIVFGLQDTVSRWKQAHRKHALAQEQLDILQRLRWTAA